MKPLISALLLLLVIGQLVQSVPPRYRREETTEAKCATKCSGLQTKFKYEAGKAYVYDLTSETRVKLGSNQAETSVGQTAQVVINVRSPCELSMQLSNVELTGADVPPTWATDLERHALRFAFDDGRIEALCPDETEPKWVLNVKRAFLSTFQNALQGQYEDDEGFETDVSGRCPTKYQNSFGEQTVHIKRTKNLIACQNNHFQHGTLRSVPYDIKSNFQNAPLMDSMQTCEHTIKSRKLDTATCTETHTFRPFQQMKKPEEEAEEAGAIVARVEQKLNFKQETPIEDGAEAFPSIRERESLAFDHGEFMKVNSAMTTAGDPMEGARINAEHLCRSSKDEVRPETPGFFTDLVYNMRRLEHQQLKSVYENVRADRDCPESARFFMEALPMCATESCVKLMVELINSNQLDQTSELGWYASFALVSQPDKHILKAIIPLIDRAPAPGLLGISSMAHSFCRHHPKCAETMELKEIVEKIASRLGEKCSTNEDKDEMLYTLKALGNIGHVQSAVPIALKCAREQTNPIEIRLAAIQSLRRQSCHDEGEVEQQLLQVYTDESEETELRIVAFVQLMRCPHSRLVDAVIEQLSRETSNQVGAFVWSFLNAKRHTTSPSDWHLSSLLGRRHIDQTFNMDPRKFSRFTELGYINHRANLGAHADSAVIFNPEGYLPRQASLNFTIHLFGRSINLFEIGARSEGMEKMVDRLFGSDGYFTNPNSFLFRDKEAKKHPNAKIQKLHDLFRKNRFSLREHMAASVYVKMFGDELAYYGFEDMNIVEEIKQLLDIEKLFNSLARQRDGHLQRNFLFLETTSTVPTLSGLPLRLAVNGTASMDVRFRGKADFTQIMRPPHSFELNALVKPSAAIEVAAMLGIETGGVRQGVKMVSRMHTATHFKSEIKFSEGKVYTAKLHLPDDKMEIFDIQSEMYQVVNNRYQMHPQQNKAKKPSRLCTAQVLSKITGLQLCAEAQMTRNPLFYPFRATFTLEKTDKSLSSYDFMIERQNEANEKRLKVAFNTPGSELDRQMEVGFGYRPQQNELEMNLRTPFKRIDVNGRLESVGADNYDAKVQMTVDSKKQYEMDGTFRVETPSEGLIKYMLWAETKAEKGKPAKFESAVEWDVRTRQSAKMNLKVLNVFRKPLDFRTEFALQVPETRNELIKYIGKVDYNGPMVRAKLDSHFDQKSSYDHDAKILVEYELEGQAKQNFLLEKTQTVQMSDKIYFKLIENGKFETSLYPTAQFEYRLNSEKQQNKWTNELIFERANQEPIKFLLNAEEKANKLYYAMMEAKCDRLNLDHKAIVQYQNRLPEELFVKVEADTPRMKDMLAEVFVKSQQTPKWTLDANALLKYAGREMRAKQKINELKEAADKYRLRTEIEWDREKKLEIDSDMTVRNKRGDRQYTVVSTAKMTGREDPITMRQHWREAPEMVEFHSNAHRGVEAIYNLGYQLKGRYEQDQKLTAHVKSDIVGEDFDYEVTGEKKQPIAGQVQYVGNLDKSGQKMASIDAIIPQMNVNNNNQDRHLKTELKWYLNRPDQSRAVLIDWRMKKSQADNHHRAKRTHDITGRMVYQSSSYRMDAHVEKSDAYKLNMTMKENDKEMIKFNLGLNEPWRHTNEPELRMDFALKTETPLFEKRDLVGRFMGKIQPDHYSFLVESECRKQQPVRRFLLDVHASRRPDGHDKKLYQYILNTELPGGIESHIDQQMLVRGYYEVEKYDSKSEFTWADKGKKVKFDMNLERIPNGFRVSDSLHTPFELLSEAREKFEYTLKNGDFVMNYQLDFNKGKKVGADIRAVMRPAEKLLDVNLQSSYENAKKLKLNIDCKKADGYWNCRGEKNVNDKYKLVVYQQLTDARQKTGFDMDWPGFTKSKGHVLVNANEQEKKMTGEVVLMKDGEQYKVAVDLNGQKEMARAKIQTPNTALKSAKLTVTKIAEGTYELKAERNGKQMNQVEGEFRRTENDKKMLLRVIGGDSPFEVSIQNNKDGHKQVANVEAIVGRDEERKVYRARMEYMRNGGKLLLKHPKREMYIKADMPEPGNELKLEIQPNVGANRDPTKIDMRSDRRENQLILAARLTDPSLKTPLKVLIDMERSSNCYDSENCEYLLKTQFDYAGIPEQIVHKKFRLAKSVEWIERNPKFSNEMASSNGRDKLVKYDWEMSAEHKASNLHFKTWSRMDMLNDYLPVKMDSGAEFKNRRREIVTYQGLMQYTPSHRKPSAFASFTTPITSIKVEMKADREKNALNLYLYEQDLNEPKMMATLVANPVDKILKFEVRDMQNGNVNLHASARMIDQYTAAIQIWHSENGRRLNDADIKVQLDRADLLRTKFYVRPALNTDISEQLNQLQMRMPNRENRDMLKQTLMSLTESQQQLLEDISTEMQPLIEGWKREQITLAEELGAGYGQIIDNLELYWQVMVEATRAFIDVMGQTMEQMIDKVPFAVQDYTQTVRRIVHRIPHYTRQMLEPMADMGREMGDRMDWVRAKSQEAYRYMADQLHMDQIRDITREFFAKITENEMIIGAIDYLKELSGKMSMEGATQYLEQIKHKYNLYQNTLVEYWSQFKEQVMGYATEQGLAELLEPMVEPFRGMDVQKKVQEFIKYIRGQLSGEEMVKQYWKQYTPRFTVNEPRKGRYEMEIPLPVQAHSLEDLVDRLHPQRLNTLRKSVQDQLSQLTDTGMVVPLNGSDEELGYSVYDTIHRFKPSSWHLIDMVPPYKSTAYLIGNQHVVTFDGHVYDFKAGCQYLLARDFSEGRFTILADFGQQNDRVILREIRTEFANRKISMHRNGKVEIDDQSVQLPWQKVDALDGNVIVQVSRQDHNTVMKTYDGILVACDAYYQVCRVTLPGRYHGQSAGLLGSNDNEPLNDLNLADGTSNNDVNKLANHWAVEGSCQTNQAHDRKRDSDNRDCRVMFKSAFSPLRPCFRQVIPGPYHQMCLHDMHMHISQSSQSNKQFQGLCNVTAAYLMACQQAGVYLDPPQQCLRCQSPAGPNLQFSSNEEIRMDDISGGHSDVVFVVEERLCLVPHGKRLLNFVNKLAANDNEMLFGWIGFGGEGVHYRPHIHTFEDTVIFPVEGIRYLVVNGLKQPESGTEREQNDPMQAIMYAVQQFPFRPAVQKTIVLLTCQLCDYQQIDHYSLQEALLNQGIVLHVITTEQIEISGDYEAAGFDAQNLYDQTAQVTGERVDLERPNDVCAVIAQESYGTVFGVKSEEAASKMVKDTGKEQREKNKCQICQCEANLLAPRTVCTPCHVIEPASLKSHSFTGIADYFRSREAFLI